MLDLTTHTNRSKRDYILSVSITGLIKQDTEVVRTAEFQFQHLRNEPLWLHIRHLAWSALQNAEGMLEIIDSQNVTPRVILEAFERCISSYPT